MNFAEEKGDMDMSYIVKTQQEADVLTSVLPGAWGTVGPKFEEAGDVIARWMQVGYGLIRFQKDIASSVTGITRNRHVGESGCIIIADYNWNIKSDRHGQEGKYLY